MLDLVSVGRDDDRDDVETHLFVALVSGDVGIGQTHIGALFLVVDKLFGVAVVGVAAGFHFGKYNEAFAVGNDVYLELAAVPVGGHNGKSL